VTFRLIDPAEGECDDSVVPSGFPCELEEGWSYLYRGMQLWSLVDPDKAEALKRLLKDEVEQEDAEGRVVVSPALAGRIVEQLRDLDQALLRISDDNYHLRPDSVEPVLSQASYLVDSWTEGGRTVYTLANTLQDVRRARHFLDRAAQLGRAVAFE
jgi:hypothetical protein